MLFNIGDKVVRTDLNRAVWEHLAVGIVKAVHDNSHVGTSQVSVQFPGSQYVTILPETAVKFSERFVPMRVGNMPNWGIWDSENDSFVIHGYDKHDATWMAEAMCETHKKLGIEPKASN